MKVYEHVGFQCCDDGQIDSGFEKVAIYAVGDEVTYAARQLEGGRWVSKLSPDEDIEHRLQSLEGAFYGKVVQFMKRPLTDS